MITATPALITHTPPLRGHLLTVVTGHIANLDVSQQLERVHYIHIIMLPQALLGQGAALSILSARRASFSRMNADEFGANF